MNSSAIRDRENLDKKSASTDHAEIVFNWERVKKTASQKIDELKCNSPKISRREELDILKKRENRLLECFRQVESRPVAESFSNIPTIDADGKEKKSTSFLGSRIQTKNRANEMNPNTDPIIYDPIKDHVIDNDTGKGELLARLPAQERNGTLVRRGENERGVIEIEDNLGPDKNAVDLLKAITEKRIDGKDLDKEERQLVVHTLRQNGQTQDAIANLLNVSRRTIVSDCKYLRQQAALEIAKVETTEIAGEIYATAKTAIDKAMKAGKLKTVSTIMRDMVELLQSMGLVYRAPKTSTSMNLNANLRTGKQQGYQKYIETIGQDKQKVVDVLDCVFDHLSNGDI